MQRAWRDDADKLTFIVCRGDSQDTTGLEPDVQKNGGICLGDRDDAPARMIGDINLFLRVEYPDDGEDETEDGDGDARDTAQIIGEVELMIAEKKDQDRGFGRAALLAFLRYVLGREGEIAREFVAGDEAARRAFGGKKDGLRFGALSVKIGQENERSLKLFEGLGFGRIGDRPSYFGEWELRRTKWDLKSDELMVERYIEVSYTRKA